MRATSRRAAKTWPMRGLHHGTEATLATRLGAEGKASFHPVALISPRRDHINRSS